MLTLFIPEKKSPPQKTETNKEENGSVDNYDNSF